MATVYAVASSKGGVGKTTTTVNLGATLASAGLSVAVVDGDIGMANLGDALGIEPDGATLHDVLAEDSEFEVADAIYEGPEGLAVVPGDTSIDGFRAADPANLGRVLDALDDYDYVLVDTGAGLSHDTVLPLGLADEVVLVSTTERDSLTDTEKTRQVVDRLGGTTRGVVLTRVDPDDPNAAEVAERLSADVIEAIPVDPLVGESMRLAEPLPSYAPASPAASAYRALAASLTGESIPTPAAVEADDEADADATEDADAETDADAPEDADAETATADDDGITLDAPADEADDEGITLTEPEADDDETAGAATGDDDADPETTDDATAAATDETADDPDETADDPDETAETAAPGTAADEAVEETDTAETADEEAASETADEGDETETADEEAASETADEGDETETVDDEDATEAADEGDETETADEADDPSGLTDDDALAADTVPSDDPLVADSAAPDEAEADDEAEETVFATPLVEEAEPTDDEAEEASGTDEDAEFVETDEDDEDDDGGRKGFLGRLLG